MFFPPAEFPPQGMQRALGTLGVACRRLPPAMAVSQAPQDKAQARLWLYFCARDVLNAAMRLLTLRPLERM